MTRAEQRERRAQALHYTDTRAELFEREREAVRQTWSPEKRRAMAEQRARRKAERREANRHKRKAISEHLTKQF